MSVSGWEPLPDVTEWWESLLDVRQLSGGPPPRMSESPYRMSGSGQLALPDVRDWLGGYSECQGFVRRQSRKSRCGRKVLLEVRKLLGGPLGSPGVVESPSRMSGSGQEALPNVREWSGDTPRCLGVLGSPPGCPGVVGGPPGCSGVVRMLSRKSRSSRKIHPDVR